MSDDLRNRVARTIDPEAFEAHDTCLDVWERKKEAALNAADTALAEIFRSDGNEEARWIEACENACPACGGSGHKDDAALAEMGGVRHLTWEHSGNRHKAAAPFFGSFVVEHYGNEKWQALWSVPGYCDTFIPGDFTTADDAKAAIEARILAAIEPAPVSVREAARVSGLETALRWYEALLADFSNATDQRAEDAEKLLDQDGGKRAREALRAIAEGKDDSSSNP